MRKITIDGNGHGLYKTVSGAYVIDDSGLSVGSSTTDPQVTLVVRRQIVIMNLHKLQQGLFLIVMVVVVFIIKIHKGNWFRDTFNNQGVFGRLKRNIE